jgi:hypothetical protein
LEKKIQKLNWICETSIPGFSSTYQGAHRKTKLRTKYYSYMSSWALIQQSI